MIPSDLPANKPRLPYTHFLSADRRSPHVMLGIQDWRGAVWIGPLGFSLTT
jgi:hypothetical protein